MRIAETGNDTEHFLSAPLNWQDSNPCKCCKVRSSKAGETISHLLQLFMTWRLKFANTVDLHEVTSLDCAWQLFCPRKKNSLTRVVHIWQWHASVKLRPPFFTGHTCNKGNNLPWTASLVVAPKHCCLEQRWERLHWSTALHLVKTGAVHVSVRCIEAG